MEAACCLVGISQPDTFVFQCGISDEPAFSAFADNFRSRNAAVGEEHFVKLRVTGHLLERSHLHAGRAHGNQEIADALMFGCVGFGAHKAEHHVCGFCTRRPDLLAIDDKVIAIYVCLGLQRCEVRA